MRYLAIVLVCYGTLAADELSPHVRITRDGMQMSGIVVGGNEVLTAAHAWTSGPVRVEFVGPEESIVRSGEVVVADVQRDLAIVRVKTKGARRAKLGAVRSGRAIVRGFRGLDAPMMEVTGNVLIGNPATGENGESLLVLDCQALSGLSGSGVLDGETGELVGVQSAGASRTYCATPDQIGIFFLQNPLTR
jgi:hypothetical protein